jgi:CHAT domain-containing protein
MKSLAEEIKDQRGMANALNGMGNAHRLQGHYAQALEHYQKSLAIAESLGEKRRIATIYGLIGNVYFAQSDYAEALDYFQKGLALSEEVKDEQRTAIALSQIGGVYHALGDYTQALEFYQKSLAIQEAIGDKSNIAVQQTNIGRIHFVQGNYALALEYYQKSLEMSEALGIKIRISSALNNIGVVYRQQGNYALALQYYQKSLEIKEAIGDRAGIASNLNNMGAAYRQQGELTQALEYYKKSLAMCETLGLKSGIALTLNNIGYVEILKGNYPEAEARLQRSLTVAESIGNKSAVATALGNLANVYEKQRQPEQALNFAERATTLARQIGESETIWKIRLRAGTAHRALKQFAQAQQAFEEAINTVETLRVQVVGGEQEQQRFFESKVSPYNAIVDLLVTENKGAEALAYAERAKARTLLDVLQQGKFSVRKAMGAEEQDQERRLKAELTRLNIMLGSAGQSNKPDASRISDIESRLEKARLNYQAFQTNLYAAHPELRVQRGEAPIINAEELATLLPDANTALLEYVVTDDKTFLFVVTRTPANPAARIATFTLPVKREELGKQVNAFRDQLAARDLGFRTSAAKLYDLLLKPAAALLNGKRQLIIAADDQLWDLPFQALLTGRQRFLIEEAAISYAPSLTALREMIKREKAQSVASDSTTLLALGNPSASRGVQTRATLRNEKLSALPEAEQEVKALGQLYGPAQSRIYTGPQAREDRVKLEAAHARILHFATHGLLNNASPLYSNLALAQSGAAGEDGLLEAWELMQLDLHADLAVLSACETARGRIGAGEGMIGLSWAMFIAGVPSLVVSQWKVESAGTRDLMVNFHRGLMGASAKVRMTKAEALRQAALKVMQNPETRHPFYWAGFILVGDPR